MAVVVGAGRSRSLGRSRTTLRVCVWLCAVIVFLPERLPLLPSSVVSSSRERAGLGWWARALKKLAPISRWWISISLVDGSACSLLWEPAWYSSKALLDR